MCPSSTSSSEPRPEHAVATGATGAERGLIQAPEHFGGGAVLRFLVIGLFVAIVVGTLAIDTLNPVPRPKLIGSERRQDARARADASFWDGSWTRLLENDMRVRSRVRRAVMPPYSWFLYTRLEEARDIVVGKDGWLFLNSRARPPVSDADVGAACVANQFAALGRLLHSKRSRLVALPIPRKSVVLEHRLPRGVHPIGELDRLVVDELMGRGILTVDLLSAFTAHEPETLFHFGDSHWTIEAELIAAEELARSLGILLPPEERETEIQVSENEALGMDLFAWIGVDGDASEASWVQDYRHDMYRVYRKSDGSQVKRHNPRELGRIAIVGTSFTARRSLPVLTRHVSGEHIWNAAMPGEGPMGPLRRFLSALEGDPWPEILVVEFPVHLILSQRGMPSVANILGNWSPTDQTTILGPESWGSSAGALPAGAWTRIASLPKGRLAHTADGVVGVRLTGEGPPGRCDIQIYSGGLKLDYNWLEGREQVVLPLMGEAPDSGPVLVFIRTNQVKKRRIASAEIVANTDPEPVSHGRVEAPVGSPREGWTQRIRFDGTERVPAMGALELVCGPKWKIGSLTVELVFDDDELPGRTIEFDHSAPREHIVVGLEGYTGRRLRAVLLSGPGKPPSGGLQEARLLAGR